MTVVVFRKRKSSKPQMAVFTSTRVLPDHIIDSAKRKPLIPHNWYLDEVGLGESLIAYYQKKYKNIKVFTDPVF